MSNIFNKIKSIEAQDEAITQALGLRPAELDDKDLGDFEKSQTSKKPLNLTINDDDTVLDLEELSLDASDENPIQPDKLSHNEIDEGHSPQKSSARLGLTPIMPIKDWRSKLEPEFKTSPKPLPKFLDTAPEDIAKPESLNTPISSTDTKPISDVTSVVQSKSTATHERAVENGRLRPSRNLITILGIASALIWIVCAGLISLDMFTGDGGWDAMSILQKLSIALMVLFPLILIGLCTAAFRHLNSLSEEANDLKLTADALMKPDETVISRTTIMAKSIQAQVDEVNLKVSSALTRMELLDDMIKSQGSSLAKSTIAIDSTTTDIEHRISTQREGLEKITGLFDSRMSSLSEMMEGHSSMLASSGLMAEQKVQEARLSVEGAAQQLSTASEAVRENAVTAARTLSGSQEEITKISENVQMQSISLDNIYRQHLKGLKTMLEDLGEEQNSLAVTMEDRLSKMRDMSLSAKVGAQNLTDASIKGRETVEALNEAASLTDTAVRARFSEMEEMVKYSTARAESISETATRQVQKSLSTTRKEISRIEADMMDLMDKLSQAEARKPVISESPITALKEGNTPLSETTPPPKASSNELPSMEYRDVFKDENVSSPKKDPSETSIFSLRRSVEEKSSPRPAANSDLDIHPLSESDMPDPLRRPTGNETAKERSKWSLRGMFGGTDTPEAPLRRHINEKDIIKRLTHLGLTPAAIVDDGCIIEAANLRAVRDITAMSEAITKRLNEPVRHLFLAVETDADLKSNIASFTQQFEDRLATVDNDREAIRKQLESDSGRAYLLCAAALNG